MKYIRTEDGIYETNENGETYNGFGCKTKNETVKIHKKDILKPSDTIEKLCDIFIIDWGNGSYMYYVELEWAITKVDTYNNTFEPVSPIIYGAIIIKGKHGEPIIKSVAKLTEKGDLELI